MKKHSTKNVKNMEYCAEYVDIIDILSIDIRGANIYNIVNIHARNGSTLAV